MFLNDQEALVYSNVRSNRSVGEAEAVPRDRRDN